VCDPWRFSHLLAGNSGPLSRKSPRRKYGLPSCRLTETFVTDSRVRRAPRIRIRAKPQTLNPCLALVLAIHNPLNAAHPFKTPLRLRNDAARQAFPAGTANDRAALEFSFLTALSLLRPQPQQGRFLCGFRSSIPADPEAPSARRRTCQFPSQGVCLR
jgi:hypothetical protein